MTDKISEEFADEDALASHIKTLIDDCEEHSKSQKDVRDKALQYLDGEMNDLVAKEGASSAIKPTVRSIIKKVMPSIIRTFIGGDKIGEFSPTERDTDQLASQATTYFNHKVVPECDVENAIYDAIHDALTVKTGILKWSAYQKVTSETKTIEGEENLLGVEGEIEAVDEEDGISRFTVRKEKVEIDICLEGIPRSAFLIASDAGKIKDSRIVGERQILTRSDLVSRGYDKEIIDTLKSHDRSSEDDKDDRSRQGDDWSSHKNTASKAMDQVQVYEVYVKLDLDDDGIAELHKICIAEGGENKNLILQIEQVDEAPYAAVVSERTPYAFDGHSIAEDLINVQKIQTSLLRAALDNIYQQNNPFTAYDPNALQEEGIEALANPSLGRVVPIESGVKIDDAIQYRRPPLHADNSMNMLRYFDKEAQESTGISDQSGGLDPDSFQNMTATTAQIMQDSGLSQADMIIRSLARSIEPAFRGLLKLIVQHASGDEENLQVNGNWESFNPSDWPLDMKCKVNIGLGAGSQQRDMQAMQIILGLQEKLIESFGGDNPYVKPDQVYNSLEQITLSSGLPSASPYFTKPDDEDIQRRIAEKQQQPSQADITLMIERERNDLRKQLEQTQMESDMRFEKFRVEIQSEMKVRELEMKAQLEREKMAQQSQQSGLTPQLHDPNPRDNILPIPEFSSNAQG
ncbi:MAG: hypothetical protein HRT36_02675 [Alphaproteobacteria bacterium]|nr:hypothetical protein [Alphaproteobacteria bacterium]